MAGAFAMHAVLASGALAQTAAQQSMTLKAATQQAISRNPEVLARFNAFKASEGELEAVAGALLPHVDLIGSIGERRRSDPLFRGNFREDSVTLQVTQLLWDGLSSYYQKRQFSHARTVRLFEFVDLSESTALEVARAYYDVLRYRELVSLAEDNYIQHRSVMDQITSRVKAGVGRRVDLEQATGRLALSESNLLVESANLHDVSARFQRLVGDPPSRVLEFPASLSDQLPVTPAEGLRSAVVLNWQVRAAVENVRAAAFARDARRGLYDPKIQFRVKEDRGRDLNGFPGQTRNSTAEVLFNFNIFNGFSDRGRVTQAEGQLGTARDQRDKACRDTRQTLSIAINDTRKLAEQRGHLALHRNSVEKARDAYRQQFDLGQRSLLDLLDTENEVFQSRRAEVNAKMDLETAYARVHAGIGRLLPVMGLAPLDTRALQEVAGWNIGEEVPEQCPPDPVPAYSSDKSALDTRAAELTRSRARTMTDLITARAAGVTLKPEGGKPAPTQVRLPEGPGEEVAAALKAWAVAWAARDLGAYLAFYSPEFAPADRSSRQDWEVARARALKRATEIKLFLSGEKLSVDGPEQVTARFLQSYSSANYRDDVEKTMVWKKAGGRWLIVRETAKPASPEAFAVQPPKPAAQ